MKWTHILAVLMVIACMFSLTPILIPVVHGKDIGTGQEIQKGVWRLTDSPIYVNVDITVPTDESLTIEPGVAVYFELDKKMTVKGELIAAGTGSNRISFAYKGGGSGRTNWKGIVLQSVTQPSTISYCTISNARAALTIEGSLYNVITNNIIRYNNAAILIQAAQGNIISDNEIYENTECGVSVRNGCQRILISRNTIYKIEGDGIVLGGGPPFNVDIKIRDNMINNNYYAGVNASFSETLEITGNTIHYNWKSPPSRLQRSGAGGNIKLNGTLAYPVKDVTIYNNKIHSAAQNGTGILIGNATNIRISYNDVYLNEWAGINATRQSSLCQVYSNNIRNNGYSKQAWDGGSGNYWDDGSRGNYWSAYKGNDTNNDGVGDTPFLLGLPKNSKDNFPLVNPLFVIMTTISTSATSTRMAVLTSYLSTTTKTDTSPTLVTITSYGTSTSYTWTFSTTSTVTVYSIFPSSTTTTVTTSSTSTYSTTTSSTSSVTTTVTTTLTVATPGRCFIASAAHGSELSPQVQFLRDLRDSEISSTFAGAHFMRVFNEFYYSFSPSLAESISASDSAKATMRVLLAPLLGSLSLGQAICHTCPPQSELRVLMAGLVSSSLLGLLYTSPIIALSTVKANDKRKKNGVSLRPLAMVWLGSLLALGMSYVFLYFGQTSIAEFVAMVSTGTLVLSTMIISPLLLLKLIRRLLS